MGEDSEMIKRYENWPDLLGVAIAERLHMPFAWGTNDCASCACSIVQSYTGVDLMAPWRGRYSTALGAARIFKEHGGMIAMADKFFQPHGLSEINWRRAMRGDIGIFPAEQGHTLATINGSFALAPSEEGLGGLPVKMAIKIWRVPFMSF